MFTQPSSTYAGTHHSVTDAFNSPGPINGDIPIMIGGQGEKKTFRLAAQYAQELNTTALFVDLPRKLDALQGHLDDLGRAREDITVSVLGTLVLAPTHDAALAKLRARSSPPAAGTSMRCCADEAASQQVLGRFVWGDADEVGGPGPGADRARSRRARVQPRSATPTTPTPWPSPARC